MKTITRILIAALLIRVGLSFVTWHPDLNNHVDWGIRFWEYGPEKFYKANVWSWTWPNQPPGTIYMYAAIRKLFEAVFGFFWFLNIKIPAFPSNVMLYFELNLYQALLKLPSILCDIGIAYLIFRLFKNEKKEKLGLFGATAFLLNPAVWYNSTIWGQTDSVINFLALLAVLLLLKRKLTLALLALTLSFYIKISLLIFLPIILVFALRQKHSTKAWISSLALSAALLIVPSLPFVADKNPVIWLYEIYKDKVLTQQLQVITANAFNLWAAIAGIHERPHSVFLGPAPYSLWGNLLFGLAYLPALYLVFKEQTRKTLIWSLSIVAFSSFMLATNMHERYLYPLFPMLSIIVAENRKLLPLYIGISGINLLNLYNFWWFPRVEPLVKFMSFGDRVMPRILGAVSFGLFLFYYKIFIRLNLAKK